MTEQEQEKLIEEAYDQIENDSIDGKLNPLSLEILSELFSAGRESGITDTKEECKKEIDNYLEKNKASAWASTWLLGAKAAIDNAEVK